MKKQKKPTAVKKRQIEFKTYLIKHDTTQKKIAEQLGLNMSSITRSIERGVFVSGPFADWWKKNIEQREVVA